MRRYKEYRHEQVAPVSKFIKGSERTIPAGSRGDKLIIGRLKTGPHKGKTRVQAILHEKFLHR